MSAARHVSRIGDLPQLVTVVEHLHRALKLKRFDIVQGRVTTDGVHVDATVARKR